MEQTSYFRSHPPQCIAGFVARATQLPDVEFDGHASRSEYQRDVRPGVPIEASDNINTVFALSCRCGGNEHFVHGYRWTDPDSRRKTVVFVSPLALGCAVCGRMTEVLDTDVHGYDSEIGVRPTNVRGEGDRAVFECPRCGRHPLEVFVRFEYSDVLFNGDHPECAGREQDLFDWFSLLGKCPGCSQVLDVADFECA